MKLSEGLAKLGQWIKNFFEGPEGESSSKRLAGILCIAAGIICAIMNKDAVSAAACFAAGSGLLISGAITKT